MSFSPKPFSPVAVECPFLDQPCVESAVQGFSCRLRVNQVVDSATLVRFLNDAVVFCNVCQKEITVSSIPRTAMRLDRK